MTQTTSPIFNGEISMSGNEVVIPSKSQCFDFSYSTTEISFPNIQTNEVSTLFLLNNKLVRFCPIKSMNNTVVCTMNTDGSFTDTLCPCVSDNNTDCVIQINYLSLTSLQLDKYNPSRFFIENRDSTFSSKKAANVNAWSAIKIGGNSIFNFLEGLSNFFVGVDKGTTLFLTSQFYLFDDKSTFFDTEIEVTTSSIKTNKMAEKTILCQSLLVQNSKLQCIKCESGYYEFGTVGCMQESNTANCQTYDNKGKCAYCKIQYYLDPINLICKDCPNYCLRCNDTTCLLCDQNYILSGGKCLSKSSQCQNSFHDRCTKCEVGKSINSNGVCINCGTTCDSCSSSDKCNLCKKGFGVLAQNKTCGKESSVLYTSNNNAISCYSNFVLENSTCILCSEKYPNCMVCDMNNCLVCQTNFIFTGSNQKCVSKESAHCNAISNSICISCEQKFYLEEENCSPCGENCDVCRNNSLCSICTSPYYNHNGICEENKRDNCNTEGEASCLRCEDSFYFDDQSTPMSSNCTKCSPNCLTCTTYSRCLSCSDSLFLVGNTCQTMNEGCTKAMISGGGCAICENGYYRDGIECKKCDDSCKSCQYNTVCYECSDNYFWATSTSCKNYSYLTNCVSGKESVNGCTQCLDGFYIATPFCLSCQENCLLCDSTLCTKCVDNYILKNSQCYALNQVENCIKASDGLCTMCNKGYQLNTEKNGCVYQLNVFVIIGPIIGAVLFITIILLMFVFVTYKLYSRIPADERNKQIHIFDMTKTNVTMKSVNKSYIVSDKEAILFGCETMLPVGVISTDVLNVGNKSKNTIKVQFVFKHNIHSTTKYTLNIFPQVVTLRQNKACTFNFQITPLCTTRIDEVLILTVKNISSGVEDNFSFEMSGDTEISTSIDPDELVEEKKIGEGGFGIIYKGTFRENCVAIKKMKTIVEDDESLNEFKKEVQMLDKFRCDYIIYFYGAVLIPSRICMVTEFAEFGSLKDLIRNFEEPSEKLRLKFCLDAAKGIDYLHTNGILHRDIKPDNILVINLDEGVGINAKLTDFGASRNINLLQTNMTFTKGIGTPVYMAPEILNKKKYKTPADIYSFGVSMYEIVGWCDAFPQTDPMFKYSWCIANFVMDGKRLPKTDNMHQDVYNIIDKAWASNPKERTCIKGIIDELEKYYNTFNANIVVVPH
ncbi:protein serine/threonine kinase, putative [Entamoeba invadens IP1]|uniref:Protein serine/threonine kinase, putative n=1 Tax=Entamoeba invadens IP1 TaxID=370355 RepID=A0A0A1TUW7_ENTIV|nr:protein serine/threonine kinase, putative [Entamoeba invadens IP1]ELP84060.1 protein serine/threonine kinase, putative [Entamoeba invadens IP1]|eukprot:XP_004183406.1 protein serine/threonine kinase, putative [Entamoeba invadens IP1]